MHLRGAHASPPTGASCRWRRGSNNPNDQPACGTSAAMISESFWYREYGGSKTVLGRKITLEGGPFEIVGVTPAGFFGIEVGRNFDIVLPLCAEQFIHVDNPWMKRADAWWLAAIGRLKEGWTLERASAQLESISKGIFESTMPSTYTAESKKGYTELVLGAETAQNGLLSFLLFYPL
ncbi:MAG: ABC transporter permease [Acidobacteriota bacterium]